MSKTKKKKSKIIFPLLESLTQMTDKCMLNAMQPNLDSLGVQLHTEACISVEINGIGYVRVTHSDKWTWFHFGLQIVHFLK